MNLTEKENGVEANGTDFDFEVKVQFVSNGGNILETDSGKGFIRLIKENNEWKVSDYRGLEYPNAIVGK